LRIVFMGTPEFAVESLRALVEGGYNVVGVITQPDKPVGRHASKLQPSAVKTYALSHGLPLLQPEKMKNEDFLDTLKALRADLQVVVAFRMLPEVVWAMPRFGTFNVHAALLPRYRGAAPINWAIINGETTTGVTTFFLDRDIDTGRIIEQREFAIPDDADAEYVYNGLMKLGAKTAISTIDKIIQAGGTITSTPQPATNEALPQAPKIFKETCRIDWHGTSKRIYDFIRGLSPTPAAWSVVTPTEPTSADGKNVSLPSLKIYRSKKTEKSCLGTVPGTLWAEHGQLFVATSDLWLELLDIQLAGKRRMEAKDFLNGFKNIEAYRLV